MGTVTKTVRIDEEMIKILDLYKKAFKKTWKAEINVNAILEHCIIKGFEDYLQLYRGMKNGFIKDAKNDDGTPFVLPEEMLEVLERYENLLHKIELEEMEDNK